MYHTGASVLDITAIYLYGVPESKLIVMSKLDELLNARPILVDQPYYDMQAENFPDAEHYYTNAVEYQGAMSEWINKLVELCRELELKAK